ncbi:MarR family winged helix-turn-helix transcriptional regulator [Nocardioides sambongensis]|uniref:MarR family winged helix-turn-helix transcriptional regulator n=1 Tax=Nocardioides sambongensis TaxID=2589074 RepID=UPI001E494B00|nr:helix-turn-helix domain-containing protein [Nocardioides sambongensis]
MSEQLATMRAGGRVAVVTALEAEIGVLMRRARRVIGERARQVHEDIPGIAYLMLGFVRERGSVRATEIGFAFHVDKAGVSRHVQQMLELGLLAKRPDPDDGRATLLSVTAEAERRMAAVAGERRRRLDERLDDWSDETLNEFVDLLARYNELLADD